MEKFPDGN
jgi:uncharacterized cupin superfamily protein